MAVPPFRRLSDLELDDLPDEDVVAYLVEARKAGATDAVALATQILVYGRMDLVEYMVGEKVPEHAVDAVAQQAMIDTMTAVFEGESVGQFVNLLKRITARRIADFWRSGTRQGREETTLDAEDDEHRRRRSAIDPKEEVDGVLVETVIEQVIRDHFARPDHERVIELAVFDDCPTKETAESVNGEHPDLDPPMSPANVDQIKSRFRRKLREALEAGDTPP